MSQMPHKLSLVNCNYDERRLMFTIVSSEK